MVAAVFFGPGILLDGVKKMVVVFFALLIAALLAACCLVVRWVVCFQCHVSCHSFD
jgi:hypothetical protein